MITEKRVEDVNVWNVEKQTEDAVVKLQEAKLWFIGLKLNFNYFLLLRPQIF